MSNCPYCHHEAESYYTDKTRMIEHCGNCDLIFRLDRLTGDRHLDLFRYRYFDELSHDQLKGRRDHIYRHVLRLLSCPDPGKLLDVGTGCGLFLVTARKMGWHAVGIDPSRDSVRHCRSIHAIDIFEGVLSEYQGCNSFDAITFINVLEHIEKPWSDIDRAASLLKSGGRIYIRFPNARFHLFVFKLLKKLSLKISASKFTILHNYSFTPNFIKRLLSDKGFKDIQIASSPISMITYFKADGSQDYLGILIAKLFSPAVALQRCFFPKLFLGSTLEVIATK